MKLYKRLSLEHTNKIIILKNKDTSNYKVEKLKGIFPVKIKRYLKIVII